MKTTVINIFGAPGSGKSTLAADIYAFMKKEGQSVELVRECIKTWALKNYHPSVFEQIYITNQQMLEETNLYGKVKYLITDSPLLLGEFYNRYYHNSDSLNNLDQKILFDAYRRDLINEPINLYLDLPLEYNSEGRYSNKEQSESIAVNLEEFLTVKTKYNNLNEDLSNRLEKALKVINETTGILTKKTS